MMSANLRAFLALLRWCEGTSGENGYRTIVGGSLFTDFSDHPRLLKSGTFSSGKEWKSTAAGAYQFLASTWDECKSALDLPDFSPESQDQAAVFLIKRRGALHAIEEGDLDNAITICNKEWASLPGSPYGQPTKSMDSCRVIFERAGGTLMQRAGGPSPVPSPSPAAVPAAPSIGDKIMAAPAIVMAAAQSLLPLVIDLFRARGSKTASRNADILEQASEVAPILTDIARTVAPGNEQQAAEAILASKPLQDQFRAQVALKWSDVEPFLRYESEERSKARDFARTWDGDRLIFGQLRFVELLSLLFVIISAGGGWMVLQGDYPAEMKGAVITLVLIAGFNGVKEFWLGSSRDSQRKTELLTDRN